MSEEFSLRIEALDRFALIVRGADTNRHDLAPEAAGLLAASLGLSRRYRDDLDQLVAGMAPRELLWRRLPAVFGENAMRGPSIPRSEFPVSAVSSTQASMAADDDVSAHETCACKTLENDMSTMMETNRPVLDGVRVWPIAHRLTAFLARYQARRAFRRNCVELASLSDRTLRDIGLTRGEIPGLVTDLMRTEAGREDRLWTL